MFDTKEFGITESSAGIVHIDGMDFGRNLSVEHKNGVMSVLSHDNNVVIIHVPGQDYFAARWKRGYAPAHYLVFLFEEKQVEAGKTKYNKCKLIAQIPLRRGAEQK